MTSTEVIFESNDEVFGTDYAIGTQYLQGLKVMVLHRAESLCVNCPDFLLSLVLESMVGDLLYSLSVSEMKDLYNSLIETIVHKNKSSDAHLLVLKYIACCVDEGLDPFLNRFRNFTQEEIKEWKYR